MRSWAFALTCLLIAVAPPALAAGELTISAGIRLGGEVDSVEGDSDLDDSFAYGLTYDIPLRPDTGIAILWSRQESEAVLEDLRPSDPTFDLIVDYLQVGGVYSKEPKTGKSMRGFVMVAVGITHFDTKESGFDNDIGFSGSIGGGVKIPFNERLALRLEGRGYYTFSSINVSGICGGVGCSVQMSSSGSGQLEGLAGLSISF